MVSADNLNIDILEAIFSHLAGNDLHSVVLVSKSFYDGVLPHLYRTLTYTIRHGKTFPRKCSPFMALLRASALAKFVQHIDISYVPVLQKSISPRPQFDSVFLNEFRQVLELCTNLTTFTCIQNILPSILSGLTKKSTLTSLRVHISDFVPAQAGSLCELNNLKTLFLDHSSWAMMDALPKWTASLGTNLRTLALYNCADLNEVILERSLPNLPNLVNLHVVGCMRIDHIVLFRLLAHTPNLEGLSFTTATDSGKILDKTSDLKQLRNVAIDTRFSMSSTQPVPAILSDIFLHFKKSSVALAALKIKVSEPQVVMGSSFIEQLLATTAYTLKRLSFIGCSIKLESLTSICKACPQLDRLDVCIPNFTDPLNQARFVDALNRSMTLRTIVDTDDHTAHGAHFVLRQTDVLRLMTDVPQLRTIVSDRKVWKRKPTLRPGVTMERIGSRQKTPTPWFMTTEQLY